MTESVRLVSVTYYIYQITKLGIRGWQVCYEELARTLIISSPVARVGALVSYSC